MHSLVKLYETNLLSLISQCLDNNSQIQTKLLQCLPSPQALYKRRFRHHLNAALVFFCLAPSRWRWRTADAPLFGRSRRPLGGEERSVRRNAEWGTGSREEKERRTARASTAGAARVRRTHQLLSEVCGWLVRSVAHSNSHSHSHGHGR